MSRGKTTCKVLKEVRRKIADANGIPLPERECMHTGDCAGTINAFSGFRAVCISRPPAPR
ncbi:MAG: hypothetical protein IJK22_07320 [Bacteroidales bacterium]|nr:hypothetical protein [Bacteroidales bacterium]